MRSHSWFTGYSRHVAKMQERPKDFENSILAAFSAGEQMFWKVITDVSGATTFDLGWRWATGGYKPVEQLPLSRVKDLVIL